MRNLKQIALAAIGVLVLAGQDPGLAALLAAYCGYLVALDHERRHHGNR